MIACQTVLLSALLTMFANAVLAAVDNPDGRVEANRTCIDGPPETQSWDFRRRVSGPPPAGRIREIHYSRLPVFDETNPRENNWLFRWGNRIHTLTTVQSVRQQLLFDVGNEYSPARAAETERNLRRSSHLYDAAIRTLATCDDDTGRPEVDVEVITRDVWSLTPELSYTQAGGESTYRFGIRDNNLLGTGNHLSMVRRHDADRNSTEFVYRDLFLGDTRIATQLEWIDSDDGNAALARVSLPFYALDARKSWSISLRRTDRSEKQYAKGRATSIVHHDFEDLFAHLGWSRGLINGRVTRWSTGVRVQADRFQAMPAADLPGPRTTPRSNRLTYPFVQIEHIEDRYSEGYNFDQIHRTEDLHLGVSWYARAGYASTSLGSTVDRVVVEAQVRDTLRFTATDLWSHRFAIETRWDLSSSSAEDLVAVYATRFFRSLGARTSLVATLNATYSHNLNSHRQVQLGGSNGLRGYANRITVGDRSVLASVEHRLFTNMHPLQLARLGFAAFVDIGTAWTRHEDNGTRNRALANIGIGMRLASSKSQSGRVIHIDLAFPVIARDDPEIDEYQFVVSIKNRL